MSGGLYNTIFGVNDLCGVLLAILELPATGIPRFRDCFLHSNSIVIHTRTGGGNRDFYESRERHEASHRDYYGDDSPFEPYPMYNEDLRKSPYFVYDADDPFDCTYANFFFSFPPGHKEELAAMSEAMNNPMPHEKWQSLFKEMEKSRNVESV